MNETLKLIRTSTTEYVLYDGEGMQLFPLDSVEHAEIISYIEKKEKDPSFIQELYIEQWLTDATKPSLTEAIANKEAKMQTSLDVLVLPITSGCNLKCPYCFAQTTKGDFNFKNYTKEDIDRLLEHLWLKHGNKPVCLVFFGGEPLVKFDIMQYTVDQVNKRYRNKLNVGYSITTNGTLINEYVAHFLKENKVGVMLSIDGPKNDFNFRVFKNGRQSIDRVLKNMDILKREGVNYVLRATITSNNPYIVETYKFLEAQQNPFSAVFAYSSDNKSHGELSNYNKDSLLGIRKSLDILYSFYTNKMEKGEPIYNQTLQDIFNTIEFRIKKDIPCSAGRTYHTVLSNGDIYSCAHLMNESRFCMGNISTYVEGEKPRHFSLPESTYHMEECSPCWAKNLCSGGCASQKLLDGKQTVQAYNTDNCMLHKLEYEYYLKLYIRYKQLSSQKTTI